MPSHLFKYCMGRNYCDKYCNSKTRIRALSWKNICSWTCWYIHICINDLKCKISQWSKRWSHKLFLSRYVTFWSLECNRWSFWWLLQPSCRFNSTYFLIHSLEIVRWWEWCLSRIFRILLAICYGWCISWFACRYFFIIHWESNK